MNSERVREILGESGALLTGHFLLASGKHSDTYLQCAKVLQYPKFSEEVSKALAEKLSDLEVDTVCGPALGGVVIGYELARQLDAKAIFTERKEGVMMLRRGFTIEPGERIVVSEDVVTTGGSVVEVIDVLTGLGAEVVAITAIVDRGGGDSLGKRFESLLKVQPPTWTPEECPLCQAGGVAVKPGGALRKGL
jgi:orotate phosphoribosyltransferase